MIKTLILEATHKIFHITVNLVRFTIESSRYLSSKDKRYRDRKDETPTYTGGVSKEYRERRREREDDRSRRKEYTTSRRRTDDSGISLNFDFVVS